LTKQALRVGIIEDDEDILTLYGDYLVSRGHCVVPILITADYVFNYEEILTPDIYLIDYRLPGKKSGIDYALEILGKFPKLPILFISADELLKNEITKYAILAAKNIQLLLKPIRLEIIEPTIFSLIAI